MLNSLFLVKEIISSEMSSRFRINQLREQDRHDVIHLLLNSFFKDEPIAKYLQLNKPIEFAEKIFNDSLKEQCSFVIHDNQTNDLIGMCLNELVDENHDEIINENNEKISFILHLLNSMHFHRNLFQQFQTDSLLHIFILSIDEKYRGYGFACQLIAKTIDYAKARQIKAIYAEATSFNSLKCFQKEYFEIYHRMKYKDYDSIRLANLDDQCHLVARLT